MIKCCESMGLYSILEWVDGTARRLLLWSYGRGRVLVGCRCQRKCSEQGSLCVIYCMCCTRTVQYMLSVRVCMLPSDTAL